MLSIVGRRGTEGEDCSGLLLCAWGGQVLCPAVERLGAMLVRQPSLDLVAGSGDWRMLVAADAGLRVWAHVASRRSLDSLDLTQHHWVQRGLDPGMKASTRGSNPCMPADRTVTSFGALYASSSDLMRLFPFLSFRSAPLPLPPLSSLLLVFFPLGLLPL